MEWLGFVAVWAVLLIPLLHVAGGGAGTPVDAVVSVGAGNPVREPAWLRVTFSEPPESLIVTSRGEGVWRETAGMAEAEQLVDLVMDEGCPELEIDVKWSHTGRRAVEIVVAPVEGRAWRVLLWREAASVRERLVFE